MASMYDTIFYNPLSDDLFNDFAPSMDDCLDNSLIVNDDDSDGVNNNDGHVDSLYIYPDQLTRVIPPLSDNYFSVLQINSRSLHKNFDRVKCLLSNFTILPTAITIVETWLNNCQELYYSIPGYNLISAPRLLKRGGGVAIYVKNGLSYHVRDDIQLGQTKTFEHLVVEISSFNYRSVVISFIYKPPNSNFTLFISEFEKFVTKITSNNKVNIVAGDYNINMYEPDDKIDEPKSPDSTTFNNLLNSFALHPMITAPTRITDNSSTLLDNIFVSHFDSNNVSGIIYDDFSDHFPLVAYINVSNSSDKRGNKERIVNSSYRSGSN
jgi:hypothetical protein